MDTTPWLDALENEIRAQDKENAPSTYNVDSIVGDMCVRNFVWRFHADLDAWIYALRQDHRVLFYLREIYVYTIESEFSNTFCISRHPLKTATTNDWVCIYSKKAMPLAKSCSEFAPTSQRRSSVDLSTVMMRMRRKRRSMSVPCLAPFDG